MAGFGRLCSPSSRRPFPRIVLLANQGKPVRDRRQFTARREPRMPLGRMSSTSTTITTIAGIHGGTSFAQTCRYTDAITTTSGVVNQLEITRKQIEDLLKQNRGKDEIEKPLMDLDTVLFGTELRLVTRPGVERSKSGRNALEAQGGACGGGAARFSSGQGTGAPSPRVLRPVADGRRHDT